SRGAGNAERGAGAATRGARRGERGKTGEHGAKRGAAADPARRVPRPAAADAACRRTELVAARRASQWISERRRRSGARSDAFLVGAVENSAGSPRRQRRAIA